MMMDNTWHAFVPIITTSAATAGSCVPGFCLWNASSSNGDFPRMRPLCKAFPLRPSRSPSMSQGPVDRCRLQR